MNIHYHTKPAGIEIQNSQGLTLAHVGVVHNEDSSVSNLLMSSPHLEQHVTLMNTNPYWIHGDLGNRHLFFDVLIEHEQSLVCSELFFKRTSRFHQKSTIWAYELAPLTDSALCLLINEDTKEFSLHYRSCRRGLIAESVRQNFIQQLKHIVELYEFLLLNYPTMSTKELVDTLAIVCSFDMSFVKNNLNHVMLLPISDWKSALTGLFHNQRYDNLEEDSQLII